MSRVRANELRLRVAFQRILLLSMGANAALSACGDDSAVGAHDAAAPDATMTDAAALDASQRDGTGVDASPDNAADTGADSASVDGADGTTLGDADAGTTDADLDADALPEFPTCDSATASAPYLTEASACYYYVDLSCPPEKPHFVCGLSTSECLSICTLDAALFECHYDPSVCRGNVFVAEAGQPITVDCAVCTGGRRPAGLARPGRAAGSRALGRYFAEASHLEAASVYAFERLHDELRAHGAPSELRRMAKRSARDEERHARVTGALARRYGSEPRAPRVRRRRERALEHIARENAVEGCVRETYGALVATWQASRARDPELRRAMGRIAADETRHAALAWAVAEWADTRLDGSARRRVARARRAALAHLEREASMEPPREVVREAGLPSARQARAMLGAMRRVVWAEGP